MRESNKHYFTKSEQCLISECYSIQELNQDYFEDCKATVINNGLAHYEYDDFTPLTGEW